MTAQAPTMDEQRAIPLTRTVAVELRKMVDTRAGRWMLIVIAAISVVVVVSVLLFGDPDSATVQTFLHATGIPLGLLLPIVGVMAGTAEWTQRTGLVTFTLEPRRGRVILAKLLAAILLGLLVVAIAVVAAFICHFIAVSLRGSTAGVDLGLGALLGTIAQLLIDVVLGVAIGLALLNTPAAIVLTLLIPVALPLAEQLLGSSDSLAWIDLPAATVPLADGSMSGTDWGQLLVSMAVWIGVPLAIGVRRVTTGEVK